MPMREGVCYFFKKQLLQMRRKLYENLPDNALFKAIAAGDYDAYHVYYKRSVRAMFRYCRWLGTPDYLLEDVLQNSYKKLWRYRKKLDGVTDATPYMKRIIANCVRDCISKERNEDIVREEEAQEVPAATEEDEVRKERRELVDAAVHTLNEGERAVFTMAKIEGRSYKEIADALDITTRTVNFRLGRAMQKVKEYVGKRCF
jgi:RNA polymerase sigma-70 factor (ECF subfamily)